MNLFEALSAFDWITPSMGLVKCAAGMRPISIYWSDQPPAYYERTLKINGIKASGGSVVPGKGFIILVPQNDVSHARKILEEAGASLA